jgi:serine/threonine protein kinase
MGPFQIMEELGVGAMGVVFRAFDRSIARPVAISQQLSALSAPSPGLH